MEKPKLPFLSQGWKQILTGRQELLDTYDRARNHDRSHETETDHGKVAEATFRKWLSGFLPGRYGVTSGYIVSPGFDGRVKLPHYDVIIYDKLESPVLWIEDSPDASAQGRSRAIPVEYARAVLEVKATFSPKTVRDSLAHLRDLAPLLENVDAQTDRYKFHLPATFCCGSVFFELRRKQEYSEAALSALLGGIGLRGYFGGIILRGEDLPLPQTGCLSLVESETPKESSLRGRHTPLWEIGISKSVQVPDGRHVYALLSWKEEAFARFAFDLIAMMQGTYDPSQPSTLYGRGNTFLEMMVDVGATIIPLEKDS